MNGYLVVIIFTVILVPIIRWLQVRQSTMETPESKKVPPKEIQVIKAKDWSSQDTPETNEENEQDQVSTIEETSDELIEAEPEAEPSKDEPVEDMDITLLSDVGPKYRTLLREAGITTVNQIASAKPEDLFNLLHKTNEAAGITKRPPTMYNVKFWIEAAKNQLA